MQPLKRDFDFSRAARFIFDLSVGFLFGKNGEIN